MIISICDDSPIGRTIVKEMVLRYQEKRQIPDLEILEYDSPIPLEEDLEKIESDMYLLDISFTDEKKYFTVRTVDGERKLRYSSIMYVERDGQTLRITTSSGSVYQSVTLRESFSAKLKPLLEDERFVQTHVSFVVNLDAVKA